MEISVDVAIAAGIYERLSNSSKVSAMDYLMYLRDLDERAKDETGTRQVLEQYAGMLNSTLPEEKKKAVVEQFKRK